MFLYSLLTATAVDIFAPIAKWTTLALLGALVVTGLILFFFQRKAFQKFVKISLFALATYLLALAITFFALDIAKHYSDAYIQENWLDKRMLVSYMLLPLLIVCAVILISLVTYAIFKNKKVALIGVCASAIALFVALVLLAVYYDKKIAGDGYYNSDTASVEQLALYLSAILAIAVIVGLALLDKQKLVFDSHVLAYAGVCVAMSFALSYIKLWDMPQGGSVTLVSLLPVMLFSYLFGAKRGVFVGFVYGLLQAVQDPWLIHPAQFLLDYPVAFASAGLAGLFRPVKKLNEKPRVCFTLGAITAGALRFVCHVLSGVFAFSVSADGGNVWAFSLVYNAYVFIDIALVIVAGVCLFSSNAFLKFTDQ